MHARVGYWKIYFIGGGVSIKQYSCDSVILDLMTLPNSSHQDLTMVRRLELFVRQNDAITNNDLIQYRHLFTENGDTLYLDTVLHHFFIVVRYSGAFNTSPSTNFTIPAND